MFVGLIGPEGAGKTTAANILCDMGYTRLAFAEPLKRMLNAIGVPQAHTHGTPDQKAAPLDLLCGHSARHAMQTLGTEWGRNCIGEDFWLQAWQGMAAAAGTPRIVADDVRFPNEARAIRRTFGGVVICIVRDKAQFERVPQHPSEDFAAIPHDAVIVNDGSLDFLRASLGHKLTHLKDLRTVAFDDAA